MADPRCPKCGCDDATLIEQVKTDIQKLKELLSQSEDAGAIREALQRLEISAYKIAESMYGGEMAGEGGS